jgi:hypothetical protein
MLKKALKKEAVCFSETSVIFTIQHGAVSRLLYGEYGLLWNPQD